MALNTPFVPGKRKFLIMVNAEDAPCGIGIPRTPSQWDGQPFRTKFPRKTVHGQQLPSELIIPPLAADQVYIWVNELRGGYGLTATAEVASVEERDSGLDIRVRNVVSIPRETLNNRILLKLLRPGNVFADIKKSTVATLRGLSERHVRELEEQLATSAVRGNSAEPIHALATAVPPSEGDRAAIEAGRQAMMRLIEQREHQGPFKDAVITRDGARCVVTGSRVREVLEAAHLIPYASGHPERDNPENGVLLRADIHVLFDRGLMSIDPDTMAVRIKPQLQNTSYARIAERARIRTGAGIRFLRYHYERFIGHRGLT